MLAVAGRPFDSEEHFFEFKWDGYRAGAMIENGRVRLMSRNGLDLAGRYPGLAALGRLPRGLALDGEIVAFRDGRPDFSLLQQHGPRSDPATVRFVAFDVLYEDFESRLDLPFSRRRQILERIVQQAHCPELVLSEGLPAEGQALYRKACEQGLEGVVSKRLSSPYASGRRNGAWVKIKRRLRIQAAIIGYIEKPGPARSPQGRRPSRASWWPAARCPAKNPARCATSAGSEGVSPTPCGPGSMHCRKSVPGRRPWSPVPRRPVGLNPACIAR